MRLLTGVLDALTCHQWLADVQAALAAQAPQGTGRSAPWPNGLPLQAHLPDLLSPLCERVWAHPALREALIHRLGPQPQLLRRHCWARYQPAPSRRLPGQAPHSWHQDGALGFDFLAQVPPYPPDARLPMQTCWIPLVACGNGQAPSLSWFDPPCPELLPPEALGDHTIGGVMDRLWPETRLHHAALRAGDALLFGGGLVHRTHADEAMLHDRISLELRWLPAGDWPARLGPP